MSANPPPQSSGQAALDRLNGEQYTYLRAAFGRGLSANQALSELAGAGLGIRRSTGLAAWSGIAERVSGANGINLTPFSFNPSASHFATTERDMLTKYRVIGAVNAINADTGETRTIYGVFGSDQFLSRLGFLEGIADILSTVSQSENLQFATGDIQITEALRRA